MSTEDVITTLHEFLVKWFSNEEFRAHYGDDVAVAMDENGYGHVDAHTLLQCLPLVAEDLDVSYQKSIYEYMSSVDVDNASDASSGSGFEVNQGGGSGGWGGGSGSSGGGHHADAVAKHIYEIQNITENNWSYIDDRDVTTSISALGDVDFDQVVASGDGAVAADGDVYGVNTGVNNGVIAGDDAHGNEVTNVTGDGNTTVGDMASGAIVASGDDNVFAYDSNVVDGDFTGQFIGGDVEDSNVIGGDSGIAAAAGAHVYADDVNVGGTQTNVDAYDSAINFGDGNAVVDESTHYTDSYNTDASTNDSYNTDDSFNEDNSTHVKDSFKVDDSFNTDASTNDSGNTDVDIDDSFKTDDDVTIKHSLNDNDVIDDKDLLDDKDLFDDDSYEDNDTDIDTDVDIDVDNSNEATDSFNSDDDFIDHN